MAIVDLKSYNNYLIDNNYNNIIEYVKTINTPEDYINYLITNNIIITLIDFVKELNRLCENIDISFIDELLDLVDKKEICISHDLLKKYGVVTTNRSNDILNMLNEYKAVENKDYLLRNVSQNPNGGRPSKEYTLHPRVFKYFLMNSKNVSKYKISLCCI